MRKPFVSIITPSLNQGRFIEETICSVLSQNYPSLEHIVIDGGSTDGTLDILRKYGNKIRWTSEPDLGQADAVNKGLRLASGEIIGWINSDDTYNPGAVKAVVKYFMQYPEIVMTYGDAYFIDENGNIIGEYRTERFNLRRLADTCFICQPTVFMRRAVLKEIGFLDINIQTCMDYDYWIRLGKHYPQAKIAYLKGHYFSNSRIYEGIKTLSMREVLFRESMETAKKHFGFVSPVWTCAYINDIGVKEQMKKYEKSALVTKALIRLFYVVKMFGIQWGWRSFVISLKEGVKYLKGRKGSRVSGFCSKKYG